MKIVHVGLGAKGRRWFEAVARFSGAQSVGAVDSEPAARIWINEQSPRLPFFERLDDALRDVRADLALVAGEPATQVEAASQALRAGLGVIVVPPAATEVSGVRNLLMLAEETSRPVFSASSGKLRSVYAQLGGLVRKGWIGSVAHASMISRSTYPADDRLAQLEYSQLFAQGAEELEAIGMILGGKPQSVISRSETPAWGGYRNGSTTELFLEFEGQVHLHYQGRLVPEFGEEEIWIEGHKGTLWTDGLRVWWRKRGWPRFLPLPKPRYHAPELTVLGLLKNQMQTSRALQNGGNGVLSAVALVESAIRSDRNRCAVSINEILDATAIPENPTSLRASGATS